jgi:hypothetical protein
VNRSIIGAASVLLALSWTESTLAQGNCPGIQFTGAIAREFPNAANACLDVVTRDGQQFAHFQARVARVRGNTVEAEFRLPDGTWSRAVAVTPDAGARVRIAGRTYRFRDLTRGQELDVYLPPDRWRLRWRRMPFAAAPSVTLFVLSQPAPAEAAAALPRTASPLPLLGALGGLLTVLGFAVAGIRRRFF